MGIARAAEGFSIFDIFAPTQENPRTSTSTIGDLRTIERKEKRAIEHQIFLEIFPRTSSSFFNRTRTRARPPHEHLEDLAGSEEVVKIQISTFLRVIQCSCRTQKSRGFPGYSSSSSDSLGSTSGLAGQGENLQQVSAYGVLTLGFVSHNKETQNMRENHS